MAAKKKATPEVVEEVVEVTEAEAVETPVEEKPAKTTKKKAEPKPKTIKAKVSNCKQLNVRDAISGTVIKVIQLGAIVDIEEVEGNNEWYKVIGEGFEGYSLKAFLVKEM